MAQIFHRSTNTFSRITIYGAVFALGFLTWAFATLDRSGYETGRAAARAAGAVQPRAPRGGLRHRLPLLPHYRRNFQHGQYSADQDLHELPFSDLNTSPTLEPVRESFRTGESISWTRVHDLPDYVYFNHSIHVNKGVGCETCHGRVDQMPLMWQENSLQMEWCLDCHRHPEQHVRPREAVFTMGYQPAEDQETLGRKLVSEYKIQDGARLPVVPRCHR